MRSRRCVTEPRERAYSSHPAVKYFAYGSNMDPTGMAQRAPHAAFLGRACLPETTLLLNSHGYATIIPCPAERVEGVLWDLTESDEARLDAYEGVGEDLYRKHYRTVTTTRNRPAVALIYIAADAIPGRSLRGYLDGIIRAARAQGLSQRYIKRLQALRQVSISPRDVP